MAKEKEVKKEVKATLSVYLTNGAHLDVPVEFGKDPRDVAAFLANQGVWGAVKGAEEFFYPPSQIFRIRVRVAK